MNYIELTLDDAIEVVEDHAHLTYVRETDDGQHVFDMGVWQVTVTEDSIFDVARKALAKR